MKNFWMVALLMLVALVACDAPIQPTVVPSAPLAAQPQAPAAQATRVPEANAPATAQPIATPTSAPVGTATPESKPIKVGLLTDQTGTFAAFTAQMENGFALGLEYATEGKNSVAGRPIQVIVKDTGSKTDVGGIAARDLIEKDKVDVLIGVPSANVAVSVADLAKQAKIVYIAEPTFLHDLNGKNFNPYVFRTSRTSVQDLAASGSALRTMSRNFVQVAPENQLGLSSSAGYYAIIKANGGFFAVNDNSDKRGAFLIPQEAKDFTPILQKVLESGADMAVVTWAGPGFVPLFTQMQQVGIFKSMRVFAGMADNQTVKAGYGALVGAYGISPYQYAIAKGSVNDWLVQKYKDKYKTPPDMFVEPSFTAAQLLVAGLRATNGDATGDKLAAALEKVSLDGVKGKYIVREYDHILLQPMYVVRLKTVDDPDFKFFDLVAELRPEDTAPPCFLEGEYKVRCPK